MDFSLVWIIRENGGGEKKSGASNIKTFYRCNKKKMGDVFVLKNYNVIAIIFSLSIKGNWHKSYLNTITFSFFSIFFSTKH